MYHFISRTSVVYYTPISIPNFVRANFFSAFYRVLFLKKNLSTNSNNLRISNSTLEIILVKSTIKCTIYF